MLFIVDFDGTISVNDTIDAMLDKFATSEWLEVEKTWTEGKIDAVACMTKQIGMVKTDHISLENFFRGIQLDATFLPFYKYVSQFSKVVIASDGLDHAIKIALRNAEWPEIPIYSNHLNFIPEGIEIQFPLRKVDCKGGNGMCKCAVATNLVKDVDGPIVLIGDGKSDSCIAGMADIVFAKGSLIKYCEANKIKHHRFQTFADVLNIIKEWPAKTQSSFKKA